MELTANTYDPGCDVCCGTGTDPMFDSPCSECGPTYVTAHRLVLAIGENSRTFTPGGRPGTGPAQPIERATDRQVAYVQSLAERAGVTVDTANLTKKQASVMIDKLTGQIEAAPYVNGGNTSTHPAPAPATTVRPNKFAGACRNCGATVDANAGSLLKVDGKWAVEHVGTCPAGSTPAPAAAPAKVDGLDLTVLPSGRYGVPGFDTRLKVLVDVVTEGKWAGWVFVKDAAEYGEGQRYGSQKPGQRYSGKITAELAAIVADPQAAMAKYGHLTSTCGRCNRPLEDETSVATGIGPVCRQKLGW